MKNSSPELQHKLMKSCRDLAVKIKTPVCPRFVYFSYAESTKYYQQSAKFNLPDVQKFTNLRFRISNSFEFMNEKNENVNNFEEFLPNIYQCDARFIRLCNIKLKFAELRMLLNPHRLIELIVICGQITKSDGTKTCLSKYLEYLPKKPKN